ncbi:MAG TPA: amidohydrolase family protein [Gammaproteobacteria bacterium]|nr:amidohydrolase family protein [Gammaproteobacteria bacterium]
MSIQVRQAWLDQVQEDAIDPQRRIVDPHHHFFIVNPDFPHYELPDLWADTDTHRVEKTVYLQCWEGYRTSGPEELLVVGETEWVDGIAAEARKQPGHAQIAGFIGTAELRLGPRVREVFDAHRAASKLFRGVRQIAAWDASDTLMSMPGLTDGNLYGQPAFRAGFKVLADMDLVFDAYHYYHQTPHLTALAQAFPSVPIVLNHLGTPLGIGPYAGRRDTEIRDKWRRDLAEIARCPNVVIKLGGLAMPWCGYGWETASRPPTSDEMVAQQGDWYHYAIEQFGPERCMFESNFPVDKCAVSYGVLWNAFKKMAARYTEAERDAMFYGTASRVYRL